MREEVRVQPPYILATWCSKKCNLPSPDVPGSEEGGWRDVGIGPRDWDTIWAMVDTADQTSHNHLNILWKLLVALLEDHLRSVE